LSITSVAPLAVTPGVTVLAAIYAATSSARYLMRRPPAPFRP